MASAMVCASSERRAGEDDDFSAVLVDRTFAQRPQRQRVVGLHTADAGQRLIACADAGRPSDMPGRGLGHGIDTDQRFESGLDIGHPERRRVHRDVGAYRRAAARFGRDQRCHAFRNVGVDDQQAHRVKPCAPASVSVYRRPATHHGPCAGETCCRPRPLRPG